MPPMELFGDAPTPPPAKINPVTLMGTGTVAWLIATAVVAGLDLMDRAPEGWLWICVAGLSLGLLGMLWAYSRVYRAYRKRVRAIQRAQKAEIKAQRAEQKAMKRAARNSAP